MKTALLGFVGLVLSNISFANVNYTCVFTDRNHFAEAERIDFTYEVNECLAQHGEICIIPLQSLATKFGCRSFSAKKEGHELTVHFDENCGGSTVDPAQSLTIPIDISFFTLRANFGNGLTTVNCKR